MHGILPEVVEITFKSEQQLRNNTILSHALFRNAQDAPLYGAGVSGSTLCSSTDIKYTGCGDTEHRGIQVHFKVSAA